MGRRAEGWKLHRDERTGNYIVRFRYAGRRYNLSTGEADLGEATAAAERKYAEVVFGGRGPGWVGRACSNLSIAIVAAKWLADISSTLDSETVETYTIHIEAHIGPYFKTLDRITPQSAETYWKARLRKVRRSTVTKELSALRGLIGWAKSHGLMGDVTVSSPPKKSPGVPDKRPRKTEPLVLSPQEIEQVIANLPEDGRRYKTRYPVKARFEVAWETALRPATLDELRVPLDWKPGTPTLKIRDEIDKARFGREVPLTARAVAALERVAPREGLIFGRHDYRGPLRAAARAAKLPKEKQERLSDYDFRHSRLTHLGQTSVNLMGLQFIAGHKHASTTSRYLHPGARAAAEVLQAAGADLSGYHRVTNSATPRPRRRSAGKK